MDAVKFIGFAFALSPIITSLTVTISDDTIIAMSTLMFILNLLSHDYVQSGFEM